MTRLRYLRTLVLKPPKALRPVRYQDSLLWRSGSYTEQAMLEYFITRVGHCHGNIRGGYEGFNRDGLITACFP